MKPICELSLGQASVELAAGRLSSRELVDACIARIESRDHEVRAWSALEPGLARKSAEQLDTETRRSPLHGIPVGIKDIIDTADFPTAYGSEAYRSHRPSADALIVERLKKLGAVILGKTVTTEFAYYTPGPTRNPNSLGHTPGGSSSGSAAAVADFQVPFALGTQTAGSMIRPGSFNGIVALKPSFGTLPYGGTHSLSCSLDTLGLFSRQVADQRLLLTALAPHLAIKNGAQKPRVAVCRTPWWNHASTDMQRAFEDYAQQLRQQGIECVDYILPAEIENLYAAQRTIMALEASRALSEDYEKYADKLGDQTLELIREGLAISIEEEMLARNQCAQARYRLSAIFDQFDLLMTPPAPGSAPAGLQSTGDPVFNRAWTLLGVPAITYPIATDPAGLPMGVQLIAPFGSDHALIDMADRLNSATR